MAPARSLVRRSLALGPAAAAVAGAALLALPARAPAFTVLGFELGLDQRDFRVVNAFADPEANDDTAPHPMFPGHVGAVRAIWRAHVEWGSGLHGDGSGDPTQPGDLGSGGASFDPSFQGEALPPVDATSNAHAPIRACGGGVIAFGEQGPNGWRIRYCDDFVWDDGPGAPVAGAVDLQAVATHEIGHAYGLGHSSVPGATMSATLPAGGVEARSIEPDDAAGLQAVYGPAAPTKPRVDAALVDAAGLLVVAGERFAPSGNEIWLTPATPGGDGTPVKVVGVASEAGGTLLRAFLPPGAGSGDLLVKVPGVGHAALSNAWPLDAGGAFPSCGFALYGLGLGGANDALLAGALAPSPGGFLILVLGGFPGTGLVAVQPAAEPAALPALGGTLLVDPSTLLPALLAIVVDGEGSLVAPLPADPSLVGARVHLQAGMVDAMPVPTDVTLSNGLALVLCP